MTGWEITIGERRITGLTNESAAVTLDSNDNCEMEITMDKKKVVVGMSGGVDSSVAAYLLKEQGYDVIGVTMRLWQEDSDKEETGKECCSLSAVEDARWVADQIGIPFYVMNFGDDFKRDVVDYFVEEYLQGRTPNPCIACNRYVKWEALLKRSLEIGADYIATGHYARIGKTKNGRYAIHTSATAAKDQTYALFNLTQEQLSHTLMPVGEYTKDEIRAIAEKIGLRVASKPDSQEICFIPDHDYAGFIERMSEKEVPGPGNFVTADGEVLGCHKGITHYTVGQRKGLSLAMGRPVFVTGIRPDTNEVVIGEAQDVFQQEFMADHINYMGVSGIEDGDRFLTKIRYAHKGAMATLYREGEDRLRFVFDEPQRAITPGQAVVFYRDGYVAGGGIIQ